MPKPKPHPKDPRVFQFLNAYRDKASVSDLFYVDAGSYAHVFGGTHASGPVVVKVIPTINPAGVCLSPHALREVRALRAVVHPNVLPLLGVYATSGVVGLHMPMYAASLHRVLFAGGRLTTPLVRGVFRDVVLAVQAAHAAGYAHRDIKPANILFGDTFGQVVLADWGMARALGDSSPKALSPEVISLWWAPPEVLLKNEVYGPAVDVWSLGVVLLDMYLGHSVFCETKRERFVESIMTLLGVAGLEGEDAVWLDKGLSDGGYHPLSSYRMFGEQLTAACVDFPPDALDLLRKLLRYRPKHRLTASEILEHPFLAVNAAEEEARAATKTSHLKQAPGYVVPLDSMGPPVNACARFVPVKGLLPLFRFGWHPAAPRNEIATFFNFVVDRTRNWFMPSLMAMFVSHALPDCAQMKIMLSCFTLSYVAVASVEGLDSMRTTFEGTPSKLGNYEQAVLQHLGGCIPPLPPQLRKFHALKPDGFGQRVAAFALFSPQLLLEMAMGMDAVYALAVKADDMMKDASIRRIVDYAAAEGVLLRF